MKKLGYLMIIGMMSMVWASEEVTVQVINAVHERSITPAFDQKLKKTGLAIHKKIEAGRYVVTLGTYKDKKEAEGALKKARMVVTKDAFIRLVNRNGTAVAAAAVVKSASAKDVKAVADTHEKQIAGDKNGVKAANPSKTVVMADAVEHKSEAPKPVAAEPAKTAVITTEPKTVTAIETIAKEVSAAKEKSKTKIAEADLSAFERKEMHKTEIAEAIAYYKNSPYHRFEPVGLRP